MTTKTLLFAICVLFLAACQPDLETIEVTPRLTLTATVLATGTATSTASPTPTATSTAVPRTPSPTATYTPAPTATPTAVLPSASVLFVRDNALQQWIPQTGEVKVLAENIYSQPVFGADIAAFTRETMPGQEYTLTIFHLPTQTEFEVVRISSEPFALSISPNDRWLASISGDPYETSLFAAYEILVNGENVLTSVPVLMMNLLGGNLTWQSENQLSWTDQSGIWVANLDSNPVEPTLTYKNGSCESGTVCPEQTNAYLPRQWAPDGRYLLAGNGDGFESVGFFTIIESGSGRTFEIPDAYYWFVDQGSEAVWLNETTLVVFHVNRWFQAKTWSISPDKEILIAYEDIIPVDLHIDFNNLMAFQTNHVRFTGFTTDEPEIAALYDLNVETGELTKLSADFEQSIVQVQWSPDGEQALLSFFTDEGNSVFLDSLNGAALVEMDSVFGLDSCCWHWYEE